MPELTVTAATPRLGEQAPSSTNRSDIIESCLAKIVLVMDTALAPSITDNEFNLIINGAESFTQCASAIAAHGRERIKKLLDSKKFQVKLAGAGARSFSERNGKLYIGLDIPIEEFEYRMGMLLQTVAESPRSALSGDSTKVKEIIRWSDIKGWIEYHDVAPRSRPSSRQGSWISP